MSIKVMSAVWEGAAADGGTLLVLLALADYANDQGVCWPSRASLAHKARLSERQVRRALAALRAAGAVDVIADAKQHTPPRYRVRVDKLSSLPRGDTHAARGDTDGSPGGTPTTPKPSLEPSIESTATTTVPAGLIFSLYEQHVGTIDPWIGSVLQEAEVEYSQECLRHSFAEASRQNVRRWAYVEAVLKAHKREGCYERARKNGRGHANAGDKRPAIRRPDIAGWRAYQAGH